MKLLKLLVLSAVVLMATVGASNGAPASILTANPGQPGAVYPTNNELIYTYGASQLEFQWGSAGSIANTSYDIEISTDPTFLNTAPGVMVDSNDGRHTLSNCTASGQAPNRLSPYAYQPAITYYWRVQAYTDTLCSGNDFTTGGSGWAVYSFRTAIAAPTLIGPGNGSTLKDNLHNDLSTTPPHPLPLFQWTSVSGASGYILEVSTVATFSSLYIDVSVPTSNTFNGGLDTGYSPSSDLPANTLFFWQVETLNSTYGTSAWSTTCVSACSFYTANVSAAPVPIAINQTHVYKTATGKVTTDFTPGIRWLDVALPSGSTFSTYEVEVSTDSTFADTSQLCFDVAHAVSYLANQTYNNDSTLNYAQLDTQDGLLHYVVDNCPTQVVGGILEFAPTTTYFWRVRAYFNSDAAVSDWSTVYSFKTSYLKPISLNASVDTTNHIVTFSWSYPGSSQAPYGYHINICFDASMSEGQCIVSKSDVKSGFVSGPSHTPYKVGIGTTMWWSVSAEGPFGPGLWAPTVSFVVP
jgi:hypothetical protein